MTRLCCVTYNSECENYASGKKMSYGTDDCRLTASAIKSGNSLRQGQFGGQHTMIS